MMKFSFLKHFLALFSIFFFGIQSIAETLVVEQGDTVAALFYNHYRKSLYGERKWYADIQKANPNIKNLHQIIPGQKIKFNVLNLENANGYISPVVSAEKLSAREIASVVEPEISPYPVSSFGIDAGFEYNRVDSVERSSGLNSSYISELNPQTQLYWDLRWSSDWTTRLRFNYTAQKVLIDDRASAVVIENASGSSKALEVGAVKSWSELKRTGFFLHYKERFYTHTNPAGRLVIDRIGIPAFKISHENDIFRMRTACFGLSLSGEILMPTQAVSYSTKLGYGGDIALYLRHEMKKLTLSGSAYYGLFQQDSDISQQRESHLGALMGVSWKFGE